jgi:hypothetical protein
MTRFTRATRIAIRDSVALQDLIERKGLVDQPAIPEPVIPQPTLPGLVVKLPRFNG